MKAFFAELAKRKVIKVGLVYLVAGWVLMQVADVMFPALGLPDWTITLVAALLIIGFPVALILSWAFEITPEGLRKEGSEPAAEPEVAAEPGSELSPAPISDKSVAVLPFVDMSAERDQEYFSDGLTEELLNVLSQVAELKVSSRTSTFAFKGSPFDIPTVAEKLNVAYVVEGSVRKAAERLRITAQLIEAATDTHLWSQTYDRELGDIFAIQEDIAKEIARVLRVKLLPEDLPEPTTDNVEAYEYYLRGRDYFNRLGIENMRMAVEMFGKATEIDPRFSRGWAGLALAQAYIIMFRLGTQEDVKRVDAASRRAIELGPDIAETHTARLVALAALSRSDEAEAEFEKAVALNPRDFEAYYQFARMQWKKGNLDRAVVLFEQAREINPDDFQAPILLMTIYRGRGEKDKALEAARAGVKAVEAFLEQHPDHSRAYMLGAGALLIAGNPERANQYVERALYLNPDSEDTQYNAACFYVVAGDYDRALDCLERGIHDLEWIDNDSDMDPLRDHPRYKALMNRVRGRN